MRRWVIHSRATFPADHALVRYKGEPEKKHQHMWEVEITVGSDTLNDEGYAVDFHAVHRLLADAVNPLVDSDLNQHPAVGAPSPTAERLAEFLAESLGPAVSGIGGALLTVSIWEGPENRVDLNLEPDQHRDGVTCS